jgi:hypothetical protein
MYAVTVSLVLLDSMGVTWVLGVRSVHIAVFILGVGLTLTGVHYLVLLLGHDANWGRNLMGAWSMLPTGILLIVAALYVAFFQR